jgi:ABC-type polysaccharide/polyol phosphate export permease
MDSKKINPPADPLRTLLSGTKLKADVNLKYRIMQRIETERSLTGQPSGNKSIMPLMRTVLSVFGVMYALIAFVAAGVFFAGGERALASVSFFLPVLLIASVCGLFLMISVFDDRRRSHAMHP